MTGYSESDAPQTEIPRSTGATDEIARLRQELAIDDDTYDERHGRGYQAELPQIVFEIPTDEQRFFSTFPDDRDGTFSISPTKTPEMYEAMRAGMPTVWRAIEEDCIKLGLDPGTLTCLIKRGETTPGEESFRPDDEDYGWHVDLDVEYVVSDTLPTEMYQGPVAPLRGHLGGRVTPLESDSPGAIVRPLPYSGARLMPYTVHRAAVATTSERRTLMLFKPRT